MTHIQRKKLSSAGGVVFRKRDGVVEIAVIRTKGNEKFQLPKGLLDKDESPEQAAVREVREETGLVAQSIGHLGSISYTYSADYGSGLETFDKTVDFFLMKFISGETSDHDDEVEEVRWINLLDAEASLLFDSEKKILKSMSRKALIESL